MRYSAIIGHKNVTQSLFQLIDIPNQTGTFLFYGPPSIGKRTVAFETAKYFLCIGDKTDGCQCQSCKRFPENHPDFFCTGTQEKIKVEDVDRILDFCSLVPFLSNKKIIILDNADNISSEASNRLLKTLEETPENFCFFIVTTNPSFILPTILSRCIKYSFEILSQEDIINIIWKKLGFELPQARILGWIASGSSVDIFSKAGAYLKFRDKAFDFLRNSKRKDIIDAFDYIDTVDQKNMKIFADMLLLIITDLLFIKNNIEDIANADLRKDLKDLSQMFDSRALIGTASYISQAKKYTHLNVNMNLTLKNILIKTYPLLQA